MRFLILTQYFPPEIGAPQVRLSAMSRVLAELGHDIEVVTSMPNHPTGRIHDTYRGKFYCKETQGGITVHRVWLYASLGAGISRMMNYLSFVITSALVMFRVKKPDYIFVESPPLFLGITAYVFSKLRMAPFIFNVADLWPDSIKELGIIQDGFVLKMVERLERWTYRKARYVNAVTEGIRSVLINDKQVPPERILFLPNGVDTEMFRLKTPDSALSKELGLDGRKVIVYAGTHGYAQGLEVVLNAMSQLHRSHPEIMMLFIGDGSEKERLVMMSKKMGLSNVRFLEPQSLEYISRLYSVAYAGLASLKNLPLFEGARPSKIFPIMSSGKPVIYSGSGEGARLIQEAGAGIVAPPEDAESLAHAIAELATDTEYASQCGNNGRCYVEEKLSWNVLISDWISQIENNDERVNHRAVSL